MTTHHDTHRPRRTLRGAATSLVVVAALLGSALVASAAPGDLDPTFGDGGSTVLETSALVRVAEGGALQADGKIVIVGAEAQGTTGASDFRVFRLTTSGSLDRSFGGDGEVIIPYLTNSSFSAAVIQDDGKIVAVGSSRIILPTQLPPPNPPTQSIGVPVVIRLNADGSRDTSFGDRGIAFTFAGPTATNSVDAVYLDVALQPDGKIVAVGQFSMNGSLGQQLVSRLRTDGRLDTTFGGGHQLPFPDPSTAYGVDVQTDGKIVVAGNDYTGDTNRMTAARYNDGGSLDTTFGGAGTGRTVFGGPDTDLNALVIQPDGRIVMAGTDEAPGADTDEIALARLQPNGSLDRSLGGDGIAITDLGGAASSAVALQSDGRILVSGELAGNEFAAFRFLADGTLDTTFGIGGVVSVFSKGTATAIHVQADGKAVLSGYVRGEGGRAFAAARLEGASPPAPTGTRCNGVAVTVDLAAGDQPTGGPDVILGTRGADRITGRGGADIICGLGGSDTLIGGGGSDTLIGGGGSDTLNGGRGTDTCNGGRGRDSITKCES